MDIAGAHCTSEGLLLRLQMGIHGSKESLHEDIVARTGIPVDALRNFKTQQQKIAQIMSWAAGRKTTRIEDRAYSLLGLFEINMPLLYGEGDNAFVRLQEQLMSLSNDRSIFLFTGPCNPKSSMHAASPDSFDGLLENIACCDCRLRFSVSKQGVSGSFRLWNYAFDIYAAEMGSWETQEGLRESLFIFVKWHSRESYRRVRVDGISTTSTSLKQHRPDDRSCGKRDFSIVRLPIKEFSSDYISTNRLKQYLNFGEALVAIPARTINDLDHDPLTSDSSLSVQVDQAQYYRENYRDGSTHRFPKDCLYICLHRTADVVTDSTDAAVLLRHHVNFDDKPVVLLSSTCIANKGHPIRCDSEGWGWHCLPSKDTSGKATRRLQNFLRDQRGTSTNLQQSPRMLPKANANVHTTQTHRTIRIGDWVIVHFLQRQSEKVWDVYYEFVLAPKHRDGQDCPIDHSDVPEGWKALRQ